MDEFTGSDFEDLYEKLETTIENTRRDTECHEIPEGSLLPELESDSLLDDLCEMTPAWLDEIEELEDFYSE